MSSRCGNRTSDSRYVLMYDRCIQATPPVIRVVLGQFPTLAVICLVLTYPSYVWSSAWILPDRFPAELRRYPVCQPSHSSPRCVVDLRAYLE